jgi:ATP-dependent helicase HrpB
MDRMRTVLPRDPLQQLPIAPLLPEIGERLRNGHLVLTAETGSGKTTGVPLALLDADWLQGRSILMLEPRRAAARMAAARMASMLGEPVGETVGYQVRFERRIGLHTRIEVLTEGLLTRRIQQDPELQGCGLLIFDEFHERNLQGDLGLALALDVASLRDDLRLMVMSATLETERAAVLLGGAPALEAPGRTHPVSLHYADATPSNAVAAVPSAVRRALQAHNGDILVFLPGVAEIQRVAAQLGTLQDTEVVPLHGSLTLAEQTRALAPTRDGNGHGRRRVLLATDIAESSLTIEGIEVVIDSGLTRKPRFEPGNGLSRLVTQPIAQASADQRAGRAGRLGPGHCYRLWSAEQHQQRPRQRRPEILDADLAPLALELLLWGVRAPEQLRWLDPPPAGAWSQAVALLGELGLCDKEGQITAAGRRSAALPTHPRLAQMLATAPPDARPLAATLAALLGERDPWRQQPGRLRPADLQARLDAVDNVRRRAPAPDFDPARLRAVQRAARQFERITASLPSAPIAAAASATADAAAAANLSAGRLLALAYPDRVGRRRDGSRGSRGGARYLLRNGTGAVLPEDDPLAAEPWLVVAALDAARGDHSIRLAIAITEAEVRDAFAEASVAERVLSWDHRQEAVVARAEVKLGAILVEQRPTPLEAADPSQPLLLEAVARDLERALDWTPAARQFCARVGLIARLFPEAGWPDLGPTALQAELDQWLMPWLDGVTGFAQTRSLDLLEVLRHRLGWSACAELDRSAPPRLETPAGSWRPIDYLGGDQPVLQAPLQELFGLAETPCIAGGRQPLLIHLLSPAGRPLQVTQDLAGFWSGSYAEVRKEMRGRYPKHHWPEDPLTAEAVPGGLKRRRAAGASPRSP